MCSLLLNNYMNQRKIWPVGICSSKRLQKKIEIYKQLSGDLKDFPAHSGYWWRNFEFPPFHVPKIVNHRDDMVDLGPFNLVSATLCSRYSLSNLTQLGKSDSRSEYGFWKQRSSLKGEYFVIMSPRLGNRPAEGVVPTSSRATILLSVPILKGLHL